MTVDECLARIGRFASFAVESIAPGRQAGFHVDRIVMRARRINDLLGEPSPNVAAAGEQTGLLAADVAIGLGSLEIRMFWNEKARAAFTLVTLPAASVLKEDSNLIRLLTQSTADLPAARAAAQRLLNAAEDLRTRAYAFEDGKRASRTPPDTASHGSSDR